MHQSGRTAAKVDASASDAACWSIALKFTWTDSQKPAGAELVRISGTTGVVNAARDSAKETTEPNFTQRFAQATSSPDKFHFNSQEVVSWTSLTGGLAHKAWTVQCIYVGRPQDASDN